MAVFVAAQPPEPGESRLFEQVYLARDDGAGNPGEELKEFAPRDIPIHCVVVLSNVESATVKMDLVAVRVAGVKPETKVVSTSFTTSDNQDRVFFTGKPRGLWVAGDYRADIYIDGNLVSKLPFRIKEDSVPLRPSLNFQPKLPPKPRSATAKKN